VKPTSVQRWIDVIKDVILIILGCILLTYEAARKETPSALIVGAGLALLVGGGKSAYGLAKKLLNGGERNGTDS
jgi:hypothetical protein